MESVNSQLLTRTINFHGQQLQKLWEGEFGESDLSRRNVKDLSFQVYGQRQKNLSFQDRGKRLKLQQFLVKKANSIFNLSPGPVKPPQEGSLTEDMYAIMPPFEIYSSVDKQKRLQFFMKVTMVFYNNYMNTLDVYHYLDYHRPNCQYFIYLLFKLKR